MASLTIREIRPGDGEGCARAWQDAGRYYAALVPEVIHEPRAEGLAEWLEQAIAQPRGEDELWLAAEHDGQVTGMIEAVIRQPSPDGHCQLQRDLARPRMGITALAVTEDHRRQGTGTALMDAAEAWGQRHGAIVALTDTGDITGTLGSGKECPGSGSTPPLMVRMYLVSPPPAGRWCTCE